MSALAAAAIAATAAWPHAHEGMEARAGRSK